MNLKSGIVGLLAVLLPLDAAFAGPIDPRDLALDAALAAAESSCAPAIVDLTIEAPGQLGVTLLAPCYAAGKVVVDHGGLVLTSALSPMGTLYVSLPVLVSDAPVTVTFADGHMAEGYVAQPGAVEAIQDVAARW
jgi:hypothetical protein